MLTVWQALALGVVQGLTEFLPISSSGHLILARHFLGWPEPPLAFDVALHVGTAAALLLYFWRTWVELVRRPSRLLLLLVAGSVPIAVVGLLLADVLEARFRGATTVAVMLIVWGVALGLADVLGRKLKGMESLSVGGALFIGAAQAVSLLPGTSRSGITMSAGLALGLTRPATARFSFLLATPAIVGAGLVEAPALLNGATGLAAEAVLVGTVAAVVSSLAAIRLLLALVARASFLPFVVYRVVLGVLILAVA